MLAALVLLPACALAQQGKLSGEVRDPHQAAVAGAKVTVTNLATNKSTTVKTGAQGEYSLGSLEAGEYSVSVESAGFKSAKNTVKVSADGAATQNLSLALAGASESVVVSGMTLDLDPKTQPQAALQDMPAGLAADSVTITAKEIADLQPDSLIDVFRTIPGMQANFQGRQHQDFMNMNGGNFQIIVDGVYMSQIDRALAVFPVQLIETITVVRDSTALSVGPLAAFNSTGSGSTGVANQGFIIIRTKRSPKTELGTVANGGSYGKATGHVFAGSKTNNWDYRVAYTYTNYEGPTGWNTQYRNGSFTFHGGYSSAKMTMDFLYYGSRGMRNFEWGQVMWPKSSSCMDINKNYAPVGARCWNSMNMYKNDSDLFAFNLTYLWNAKNRTIVQYGFDRMQINAGMNADWSRTQYTTNEQDNTEADIVVKHTYQLKNHALSAGTQWMKYIAPSGSANTSGITSRIDQLMASWFVQDDYHLFKSRLVIDGGIRGDKLHKNSYLTVKDAKGNTTYPPSSTWGPTFITYVLGANYKLTDKTSLSTRYAHVKTPAATNYVYIDSTGKQSSTLPDQTNDRLEMGATTSFTPHFVPSLNIYLYQTKNGVSTGSATCTDPSGNKNVAYWYDQNGNEIDCVTVSPQVQSGGMNLAVAGKVFGPFSYNAGYAYNATDNTANNRTLTHNTASGSLKYATKAWFANFNMTYVGPKWSASSAPNPATQSDWYGQLANFTRFDLNAGYNFKVYNKPMTFTFAERNLSDNQYATMYKTGLYTDAGRTWNIQLATKIF